MQHSCNTKQPISPISYKIANFLQPISPTFYKLLQNNQYATKQPTSPTFYKTTNFVQVFSDNFVCKVSGTGSTSFVEKKTQHRDHGENFADFRQSRTICNPGRSRPVRSLKNAKYKFCSAVLYFNFIRCRATSSSSSILISKL